IKPRHHRTDDLLLRDGDQKKVSLAAQFATDICQRVVPRRRIRKDGRPEPNDLSLIRLDIRANHEVLIGRTGAHAAPTQISTCRFGAPLAMIDRATATWAAPVGLEGQASAGPATNT